MQGGYAVDVITSASMNSTFNENIVLATSLTFTNDRISPQIYQQSWRKEGLSYTLGITQPLSNKWVAQFEYFNNNEKGLLADLYKVVTIITDDTFGYYPVIHPSSRVMHAVGARSNYMLPHEMVVQLAYRYYTDSWKIHLHTVLTGLKTYLWGRSVLLSNHLRYYQQTSAYFFQRDYNLADWHNRSHNLYAFLLSWGYAYRF